MVRITRSRMLVGILGLVVAFSGCTGAASETTAADGSAAPSSATSPARRAAATKPVTLPVGTAIKVLLDHAVASDKNQSGDNFEATVAEAVMVDGATAIPKGARVAGTLTEVKESGRLKGVASLKLV